MAAYDPQCLFADPFAGFNGVERFQRNVSNLGGLMQVGARAAAAQYRVHSRTLAPRLHPGRGASS